MSQQNKIIFGACIVAALIAVAMGQVSWNPQQCMQAQNALNSFTQEMTSSFSEFTQQLANEGNSAIDVNGFSNDANELMQMYTGLANTNGGIDGGRIVTSMTQIARQQLKLSQYFMNFQTGPRIIRLYMSLAQKMLSNQSDLISSIASSCSPTRGGSQ